MSAPAELTALSQWVCWRYEERGDKTTKAPINAKSNGCLTYAKSNDPTTWASYSEALATCERHPELAGVGFCFAPDDGLTGIDLDHVIDPDTGELKPEAAEILEQFVGTYCEVSPSGTGLRLFCYGKPGRSGKNVGKSKWLEVYSHPSNRYLTVTGNHWPGSATTVTEQQAALDWLHARFMTASTGQGEQAGSPPVDAKRPAFAPLNLDDAAILDKASKATNGADFNRLWSGDASANGDDDSAADLALCNLLAFWTHGDADRIDRLFRQSGLMRQKWNEVHYADGRTYGQATVDKAIAGCREFYGDRHSVRSEPRATYQADSTGGEPDDKDAPKQKPESVMAAELGLRFADRLRVHPTTREWLLLDDRTGLFKPCPDAAVERLVYGAVADEGLEKFTNNYVVGITRLLRHEIALDDQDDLDAQAEPRLQWADEFCQNRPDTCWLIDGHMPACSVGVLFGDAESWKTFLAIDMAGCVATGREWRGKEVKQGNVLFIAGEGGFGLRARIQAWFDHHNEPMRNFAVSTVPLELCDPQNANELIADIRRFAGDRQFELIVLDTLSTHFGFGDENATVDMNKFRRAVLKLSKATGAAVAIIHHPGHTNKDREKGAITLRQGIDWGYRVERVGEVTTITPTKMKDAPPPPPLSWTLKQVPLPWTDAKGKPIDGAVLVPTETQEKVERGPFLNAKTTLALEALRMALLTHGMEDRGVVTVSEEEWRQAAYDAGIASSDAAQNARRMAFNRARETLLAAKRVECFEGRYWIPHRPAQDRTQAECAAEIQRTPAQDRTNRSKNEQPQGGEEVDAIDEQMSQQRNINSENPPLYAENAENAENAPRTDRTDPHKTAHCAGLCGLDTPSATGAQPHTTAHTPIGVCGCAGGPCADVPHGGGIDSREVGGMAEWRNGDEPEPPVAPPPVEAPLSQPIARRILQALRAAPAGFDTSELTRQVGNDKGASSAMIELALGKLAKSGQVARMNGRWVATELERGGIL